MSRIHTTTGLLGYATLPFPRTCATGGSPGWKAIT